MRTSLFSISGKRGETLKTIIFVLHATEFPFFKCPYCRWTQCGARKTPMHAISTQDRRCIDEHSVGSLDSIHRLTSATMSNCISHKMSRDATRSTDDLRESDGGESRKTVGDLHPDDVLMGRGVARNDHSGNVRYREIVARHKEEYLATNKRAHKDMIARKVQKAVESSGGRFLRECSLSGAGRNLFVAEDSSIVLEKVKQALRFVGRETKDQIRQTPHSATQSPSRLSQSLPQTSPYRPSSTRSVLALHPEAPPSLQQAFKATVSPTERHSLAQAISIEPSNQRWSQLDVISALEHERHHHEKPVPYSTTAAAASCSSASMQGREQPSSTVQQFPTTTQPVRTLSTLLDSIRTRDQFAGQSLTPMLASCPSSRPGNGVSPPNMIQEALMLVGRTGAPVSNTTSLPLSSSYPSLFGGLLASATLEHSLPPTDLGPSRSDGSIAATNPAIAAIPSMNDDQIRMLLTLLNSRRQSEQNNLLNWGPRP
jgi:hypothetical protein